MTDAIHVKGPHAMCAQHTSVIGSSTVSITDLPIEADIGVLPEEIGQPQTLIVSVTLGLAPIVVDQLGHTVDYRDIVSIARALGSTRTALIETFANRFALACMNHPLVLHAEVEVRKPSALSEGLATARVLLRRAPSEV